MIRQVVSVTVEIEDDKVGVSVTVEIEDDKAGCISNSRDRG